MIVHDGTSGPTPVLSVPYSGRHASVAVEIDLRIDGPIHPTGSKSLGVYLRMNDDSAYRMSLTGQTTIEYAEASLQRVDNDENQWIVQDSISRESLPEETASGCIQQWCSVRVETYVHGLRIYIDRGEVFRAFDTRHFEEGAIGVFSSGVNLDVRAVRVYDQK
jgi:hypothetical protein